MAQKCFYLAKYVVIFSHFFPAQNPKMGTLNIIFSFHIEFGRHMRERQMKSILQSYSSYSSYG
jgi:hypothetical protein